MDIWMGDDPLPSCYMCMDGNHKECLDLLWSDKYGLYACGCENPFHSN